MAFGWGSANQRDEREFMVLDGLMVVVAGAVVTVVHPGWSFPALAGTIRGRVGAKRGERGDDVGDEREEGEEEKK